jgi:hypothetical protein
VDRHGEKAEFHGAKLCPKKLERARRHGATVARRGSR